MTTSKRPVSDCRRAALTKRARPCLTPWGQFTSVTLAVEHAMRHEGDYVAPFIIRAVRQLDNECRFKTYVYDDASVMKQVRKNLVTNTYALCKKGSDTNNGDFRLL